MTPESFEIALRTFKRRKHFRPFAIELTSGERLIVTHPEVANRVGSVVMFFGSDGRHRVFDSSSVCSLLDLPGGSS